MRTHPVDKLLEQHCYKSAAGLLQLVRFYVCIRGKPLYDGVEIIIKHLLIAGIECGTHRCPLMNSV